MPMEALLDALPKSMLQEVQMIRRWDGLEPVADASRDWSGEEAVEVGREARRKVQCWGSGMKSWRRMGGERRVAADRKGSGWREAR